MPLLPPAARAPRWYPLTVSGVHPLTARSTAITLAVPPESAAVFEYAAGQYLTVRATVAGEEVHQSYSICIPPSQARAEGVLRVGVARVEGGRLSNWLNDVAEVGTVLQVLPPLGDLTCPPRPGASRHHGFVAAGSGITPVMALIGDLVEGEPHSRATVVLGNRDWSSVMFGPELDRLATAHPGRLEVVHVLTREASEPTAWTGRLEGALLEEVLEAVAPIEVVDEWFVCGPPGLVEGARDLLGRHGAGSDHVHVEAFTANP